MDDREEVGTSRAELAAGRELFVDRPVRFVVPPVPVDVLRLPAVEPSFHPRGKVLLPEGAIPLLTGILEVTAPSAVAVVGHAGHDSAAAERLSIARAQNLHALLLGASAWADDCAAVARTSELQHVLWWVARELEYDCEPGPCDGGFGDDTREALHRFRSTYNDDGFDHRFADLDAAPGRGDWLAFASLYHYVLGRRVGRSGRVCGTELAALPFAGAGHVGCGKRWTKASVRARDYDAKVGQRVEVWLLPPHCGPVLFGEDVPGESLLGEPGYRTVLRKITADACAHPPVEEPEKPDGPDNIDLPALYEMYRLLVEAIHAMRRGQHPSLFDRLVAERDRAWAEYEFAGGDWPRLHDLQPAADYYERYRELHEDIEQLRRVEDPELYDELVDAREQLWETYLDADGIRERLHDPGIEVSHLAFALQLDPAGWETAYNMALICHAAYFDDAQDWFDAIVAAQKQGRRSIPTRAEDGYELPALFEDCGEDYAPLEVITVEAEGTSAFVTHNDRHIVIAFRGTEPGWWKLPDFDDIKSDLEADQDDERSGWGRVHAGFQKALPDDALARIFAVLDAFPELPVFVTGHSLGGALALLCATQITTQRPGRELALYTFGQPRVGDDVFAQSYAEWLPRYFRHAHECDLIAVFPPSFTGVHWGRQGSTGPVAAAGPTAPSWITGLGFAAEERRLAKLEHVQRTQRAQGPRQGATQAGGPEPAPGLEGEVLVTYLHFGREQVHQLDGEVIAYHARIEDVREAEITLFDDQRADRSLAMHGCIRYAGLLARKLRSHRRHPLPDHEWVVFFEQLVLAHESADVFKVKVRFDGPQYLPALVADEQKPITARFTIRADEDGAPFVASKVTVFVTIDEETLYSEEVTESAKLPGSYVWQWNGADDEGVFDSARMRNGRLAIAVEVQHGLHYAVDFVALDVRRPTKPWWNIDWAQPWWGSLELGRFYDADFDVDVLRNTNARTVEVRLACSFAQWLTEYAADGEKALLKIERFLGAVGALEYDKLEAVINAGKVYLGAIADDAVLMDEATMAALTRDIREGMGKHWSGVLGDDASPWATTVVVEERQERAVPFWVVSYGGLDYLRSSKMPYIPGILYYQPGYWAQWGISAIASVQQTSAHELGHAVLYAGRGLEYSITHKGTSTIGQEPRADAPRYPVSGNVDLMYYHQTATTPAEEAARDDFSRRRAAKEDLMTLASLATLELDT